MSVSSSNLANLGNVPRLGQEKNVTIKINKNVSAYKPQSATVDAGLAERLSIKAKSTVVARKSVASLVNENKGSVGKKVDIRV